VTHTLRRALLLLLIALPAFSLAVHPANMASAKAKIQVDGSFQVFVRFDILAYCLDSLPSEVGDGPMNAILDGPTAQLESLLNEAKARFISEFKILGDGSSAKFEASAFPTAIDVKALGGAAAIRLPAMAVVELRGRLPGRSKSSSLVFPPMLGAVVLTTEFPYQEPVTEPVEPGESSKPLSIPTAQQVQAVRASIEARREPEVKKTAALPALPRRMQPASGSSDVRSPFADARASAVGTAAQLPPHESHVLPHHQSVRSDPPNTVKPASIQLPSQRLAWYQVFPSYVQMGFRHIIPDGLDHILFVLGLFLLSTRTKDLLKQVTAFTVAHSLTLALSLYGVIQLPTSIVEPIIALSIVFVAVENLVSTKMNTWRTAVVFVFGLMHGLGFASALREVGISRGDFLTGLIGFNCGVELGQLCVVFGALLLVGWFRAHRNYRPMLAVPASAVIALIAVIWTVQRIL
jgi:hydrogenase/urease accessory protein HupE